MFGDNSLKTMLEANSLFNLSKSLKNIFKNSFSKKKRINS